MKGDDRLDLQYALSIVQPSAKRDNLHQREFGTITDAVTVQPSRKYLNSMGQNVIKFQDFVVYEQVFKNRSYSENASLYGVLALVKSALLMGSVL